MTILSLVLTTLSLTIDNVNEGMGKRRADIDLGPHHDQQVRLIINGIKRKLVGYGTNTIVSTIHE